MANDGQKDQIRDNAPAGSGRPIDLDVEGDDRNTKTRDQSHGFPTEHGVEKVRGDQLQAENCSMAAMKSTCSIREPEKAEIENEDIEVLNDDGKEPAEKSEEALRKILAPIRTRIVLAIKERHPHGSKVSQVPSILPVLSSWILSEQCGQKITHTEYMDLTQRGTIYMTYRLDG
ncbi:hypothetical protein HYC85_030634 [Camellia sinensis]|uniref:Uncharacterized protein n=1 Tax=Camellia sinensis TaxID=4442 RepID=A0A7J7G176_CAMSI|nr:hypothetical protein HYC85_030634 [Camellia sinensis]